jgi:gliding motility-associated-like protein
LVIEGLDIVNLDSLGLIKYISYFSINQTGLINLKGLSNLKSVGTRLFISSNKNLVSLTGLESLNSVENINILWNDELFTLKDLPMLSIPGNIIITFNHKLKSVDFSLRNDTVGAIIIYSNSQMENVDSLRNIKHVYYSVEISGYNISSFLGLSSLMSINGDLKIGSNTKITNFDDLENLLYVGGALTIYGCSELENISGLKSLIKIGRLNIHDNSKLVSLSGLEGIDTLKSCDIYSNAFLNNLIGLDNLKYVHESMDVSNCDNMLDLQGLENLNYVFNLEVYGNKSLSTLEGLKKDVIVKGLSLTYNPALKCCYLAKAIVANNPVIYYGPYISNNDIGCNSIPEVMALTPTTTCCVSSTRTDTVTICQGQSYKVGANTYTQPGIYRDSVITGNSCSEITITHLRVLPVYYQVVSKTFCIGQSFTLNSGRVVTTSGIYKDTLPAVCDSIIEYRLQFLNSITTNVQASVCQGKNYTLPDGSLVATSGTYRDTLLSAAGCDSIVVTQLIVQPYLRSTQNITLCQGKSYTLPGGRVVSMSGTYSDTIKNNNGCDSIVVTQLNIIPPVAVNKQAVICQGQSYLLPGGRTVKVSGTYYDTIKKPGNCDSIFITSLSVIPPVPDVVRVAVCSGQSYTLPGGVKVKTAGTYSDTLKTAASCDSVITTILTVFPNTFKVSLPVTDTILSGSAVALLPQYTGGTAIRWNWSPPFGLNCTDCEQPMAMPEQSTTYLVTATTSDGCQDTAQTQLVVRTSEVYIPTAFSPNNDGLHDRLDVFAMSAKSFHIRIYNRWGEIVFESQDMQQKWDGTFKGDICPTDQYIYVVDVVWQNDKAYHKQGMVMLLR